MQLQVCYFSWMSKTLKQVPGNIAHARVINSHFCLSTMALSILLSNTELIENLHYQINGSS